MFEITFRKIQDYLGSQCTVGWVKLLGYFQFRILGVILGIFRRVAIDLELWP